MRSRSKWTGDAGALQQAPVMVCKTLEAVIFAIKLIGGSSHSRESVKRDRDMMRSKEGARMVRRGIKDGSPAAKSAPHTTPDEW